MSDISVTDIIGRCLRTSESVGLDAHFVDLAEAASRRE
jgi:hypothetical protein